MMWSIIHTMVTIQVVLDEGLLVATDRLVKRIKSNRSALVREALREYLKKLRNQDLERRDREGYERHPDKGESAVWEGVAAWPEE